MSTEAAFLRAICARPGDDTLRLVYADWLEDHSGYAADPGAARARAEFIRVQVELARVPAGVGCDAPGAERPGRHAGTKSCPKCDLAVRAERLFGRLPPESIGGRTARGPWTLGFPDLRQWERGSPRRWSE